VSYDAVLHRKRAHDKKSWVAARGSVEVILAHYSERPKQSRPEYSMQLGDKVCDHNDLETMLMAAGLLKE
jgi:hypothetical protein